MLNSSFDDEYKNKRFIKNNNHNKKSDIQTYSNNLKKFKTKENINEGSNSVNDIHMTTISSSKSKLI